jgi:hypothetical protein
LPRTKTDEIPAVSIIPEARLFYPFGGSVASARNAWGKVFTAITFTPPA